MKLARFVLMALVFPLLFAECHYDLNDPGTKPPPDQFFFPSGLVLDPAGQYLYVSNANYDLHYGSGTIVMVDLERFNAAVDDYRQECDGKPNCTATGMFSKFCRFDGYDASIVNCDETAFILKNQTIGVGNYAGRIRFYDGGVGNRRLFIAVRGDPSITYVNVGDVSSLTDVSDPATALNCVGNPATLKALPDYDAVSMTMTHPATCESEFKLQQWFVDGDQFDETQHMNIPNEPFGMELDSGLDALSNPYAHLLVSHLAGGQVSLIDGTSNPPSVSYVSPAFFIADAAGRHGAFGLAPQTPGNPSSLWYMTSNLQPTIATFHVAEVNVIVPNTGIATDQRQVLEGPQFTLGGVTASTSDEREIVFDPTGNRAFITNASSPSVAVLDTSITLSAPVRGQPYNAVTDAPVPVCSEPSHMGVRRTADANGVIRTQLYVVCFTANQVAVVDPDRSELLHTIPLSGNPNEIEFSFSNVDDKAPRPSAYPDGTTVRSQAYVADFQENAISVIDLSLANPRVIARIGYPENQ